MESECFGKYGSQMDSDVPCSECEHRNNCAEKYMEPAIIRQNATKQLEYDIHFLDDNEILALTRIIHAYVMSQKQSYIARGAEELFE